MAGLGRKVGILGFVFSVGVACTQLFGGEQNTVAPREPPKLPNVTTPTLRPAGPGAGICTTGQTRCEGALLQTCADDGNSWVTQQRCGAAALCQADPAACLPAACDADEMTCAGAVLQKCNQNRNGWDLFATCLSPAHCNADLRQCLTEPCNPGDRRCDRSDADQSPVLESCRDDRSDWAPLDSCVTRELCDQTLTVPAGGGLVLGSDGMLGLQAQPDPTTVVMCNAPACASGEVRCEGSQLEYCAEGRTGWTVAEACASPALCDGSLTNLGPSGTPQCLVPACAVNQHQCTDGGVLQVCSEDRTGFRVIQACIGPPFCNAVLADQGQEGCTAAPCEAGQMQCNGAQIQVCRQDRTALDNTGPLCESAALCNAKDPANAFCETPACRRGATSGDEFKCDGARLQRCNESLTGYDAVQECVTAELCDASQRFNGCQAPKCQPGQHACNGEFLQTCNDGQTAFENTENCGAAGQCDANAGRCADPCLPGTVRCNNQSGDLEECLDPLVGWQTRADCLSLPLCDAANQRCNPPVCATGARRCETRGQNPVVTQCAPGREAFNVIKTCNAGQICDAQNNECDVCTPNAVRCEGDTLVSCDSRGQAESRQACGAGLCSADQRRCLACGPPGSARCTNQQLLVCTQNPQGEFEASEFCETNALCAQTLTTCGSGLNGQACQCNDGACRPGQVRCNNGQVQRCNAGLTGFDTAATCNPANLCNQLTADCNTCQGSQFSCNNNQLRQCAADGRSFSRQNIAVECINNNTQALSCQNNGVVTANCTQGCTPGRGCNQCSGNGATCQNGQVQRCVNGFFQTENCPQGFGCTGGRCNTCNQGACANGTQFQTCDNGQLSAARNCPAGQACTGGGNCAFNCQQLNCNDNNVCTNDSCSPQTGCAHANNTVSCSDGNACNGNETCQNGACSNPPDVSCNDNRACTTDSCNPTTGACSNTVNCPAGQACGANGACVTTQVCTAGAITCNGTSAVTCNAAGTASTSRNCAGTATPFCTPSVGCVECVANADCNGRVAVDQCRRAQCTRFDCVSAILPGIACNDGHGCNGPDSCRADGQCLSDGPFVECPFPECADFSGCTEDAAGNASCFADPPSALGSFCTTTTGARGNCNGVSATFCDPRLPCRIDGNCPPNAPSCNGGFCGPFIIE